MSKTNILLMIFTFFLVISGVLLVGDFKLIIGISLLMWANNIDNQL